MDYAIMGIFGFLLLLYKFLRDWYGTRDVPRKIDEQAAKLLREEGYRIQARAAVKYIDFAIEGKTQRQKVKADLVVRRGLKKYVAEVNAKEAGSVRNADIRRRILEYQIAFAPSGIMTVDMDRERVKIITIGNRRYFTQVVAAGVVACLGALVYLLTRSLP
jgi:hypothetical protein